MFNRVEFATVKNEVELNSYRLSDSDNKNLLTEIFAQKTGKVQTVSAQLTLNRCYILRSQIGTSSLNKNYGDIRYMLHVFTEEGVAMLVSVLHSKIAVEAFSNEN